MKLKAGSLKRSTKLKNPKSDSSRKKRERTQNQKHYKWKRSYNGHHRNPNITRDDYKQLYANKTDGLEETDKFIGRYNLPRLHQDKIETMKRPITSTEIETMI